jgi:hypothetical protein
VVVYSDQKTGGLEENGVSDGAEDTTPEIIGV